MALKRFLSKAISARRDWWCWLEGSNGRTLQALRIDTPQPGSIPPISSLFRPGLRIFGGRDPAAFHRRAPGPRRSSAGDCFPPPTHADAASRFTKPRVFLLPIAVRRLTYPRRAADLSHRRAFLPLLDQNVFYAPGNFDALMQNLATQPRKIEAENASSKRSSVELAEQSEMQLCLTHSTQNR